MSPRIVLRPATVDDLDAIVDWITALNLDAPLAFDCRAHEMFGMLSEHRWMGRLSEFAAGLTLEVRQWPIVCYADYIIFYRPLNDGVEVLRVLHGARDVDRAFQDPASSV